VEIRVTVGVMEEMITDLVNGRSNGEKA